MRSLLSTALVALVVLLLGSCSRRGEQWNVLLVTLDTTRADHIGCYGHPRSQTPNIDQLAADGHRFANAFTAVPITAPSHSTILTGKYPPGHGVRDNGIFVLAPENLSIAEVLSEQGYATGAAVASFPLSQRFGLDQGFGFYDDQFAPPLVDPKTNKPTRAGLFFDERPAHLVNDAIEPWLEENSEGPFFAWVHYFDPHHPLRPPPPYNQIFLTDPYLGEIAFADEAVGGLIEKLTELGVRDRTIVVITADHGEGLGDHGESTHSTLIYNSTLHVPLVIDVPQTDGGVVIEQRVGTVDIAPTILALLGLEIPEEMQGRDLAPLVRGAQSTRERTLYAETLSPRLGHSLGELRALFSDQHKLIYGPKLELFDTIADPGERRNLAAGEEALVATLTTELEQLLTAIATAPEASAMDLDPATLKRLEALGYVSSSRDSTEIVEKLRRDGIAPQDRVGDVNLLSSAKSLLSMERGVPALQAARKLLELNSTSPFYRSLVARAHLLLGNLDEAIAVLAPIGSEGLDENSSGAFLMLARDLGIAGRTEEALSWIEKVDTSENPSALWVRATLWDHLGDVEASKRDLLAALERDAEFVPARIDHAVLLARQQQFDEAEAEFARVFSQQPYDARAHYNFGAMNLARGETVAAAESFRTSIRVGPTYLKPRLGLIAALLEAGERSSAEEEYTRLTQVAPGSLETHTAKQLLTDSAAAETGSGP